MDSEGMLKGEIIKLRKMKTKRPSFTRKNRKSPVSDFLLISSPLRARSVMGHRFALERTSRQGRCGHAILAAMVYIALESGREMESMEGSMMDRKEAWDMSGKEAIPELKKVSSEERRGG